MGQAFCNENLRFPLGYLQKPYLQMNAAIYFRYYNNQILSSCKELKFYMVYGQPKEQNEFRESNLNYSLDVLKVELSILSPKGETSWDCVRFTAQVGLYLV